MLNKGKTIHVNVTEENWKAARYIVRRVPEKEGFEHDTSKQETALETLYDGLLEDTPNTPVFPYPRDIKIHVGPSMAEKPKCPICNRRLKKENMLKHYKKNHQLPNQTVTLYVPGIGKVQG